MQKIILGTVIAAFGALNVCAAFAQDMTLTSTEVADGATIKDAVGGGPAKVRATTRSATSGRSGGMRAGRVLSRQSPVTPSSPNRSCQRQITVLALPVARMMSAVP